MPTTDFDSLFTDWETPNSVKNTAKIGVGCFGAYFVFYMVISLVVLGFLGWAIFELVTNYT